MREHPGDLRSRSLLMLLGLVCGCEPTAGARSADAPSRAPSSAPAAPRSEPPATAPPSVPEPTSAPSAADDGADGAGDATLLRVTSPGDGDSWKASDGNEYRLALVNTPEVTECFGAQSTERRRRLTDGGFRVARVTNADGAYGRVVAVLTSADGTDIGLTLAEEGYADDRYVAQYRAEAPDYAPLVQDAVDRARAAGRGRWSACASRAPAAAPPASSPTPAVRPVAAPAPGCHPDYRECVPVKGDGSGRGEANDLDCADVGFVVHLFDPRRDAYRLDGVGVGDGVGCETYA